MSIDMDEHEEEREGKLQPTPHRTEEEVRGAQHIHVHTNELRPTHSLLPLWGGGNAVTLEDIAHRLVADRIAQVEQSTHNPVIAPRAVLPGHLHDEAFKLLVNARTPTDLCGAEVSTV